MPAASIASSARSRRASASVASSPSGPRPSARGSSLTTDALPAPWRDPGFDDRPLDGRTHGRSRPVARGGIAGGSGGQDPASGAPLLREAQGSRRVTAGRGRSVTVPPGRRGRRPSPGPGRSGAPSALPWPAPVRGPGCGRRARPSTPAPGQEPTVRDPCCDHEGRTDTVGTRGSLPGGSVPRRSARAATVDALRSRPRAAEQAPVGRGGTRRAGSRPGGCGEAPSGRSRGRPRSAGVLRCWGRSGGLDSRGGRRGVGSGALVPERRTAPSRWVPRGR
jgi:hypothetical protein